METHPMEEDFALQASLRNTTFLFFTTSTEHPDGECLEQ
jgi:hypothetical protein